jgi:hypothetical protein
VEVLTREKEIISPALFTIATRMEAEAVHSAPLRQQVVRAEAMVRRVRMELARSIR